MVLFIVLIIALSLDMCVTCLLLWLLNKLMLNKLIVVLQNYVNQ